MTDQQVRERRNVWTLSRSRRNGWHPTLVWYARAVGELKRISDPADPRSWAHLSNIHGTDTDPASWPPGITDRHWNACQHGSWFFLPWHRIYLHHFETIVRGVVRRLGGPAGWSLPFWDYDPADPETLGLPRAFLVPTLNGLANPLFVPQRRAPIREGQGIPPEHVETTGWVPEFTSDFPIDTTFGGPRTGWSHEGEVVGQLEREPHGTVHVRVGGVDALGFMSLFTTAPLDPIFWLHHANIDRLWERWRNMPGHLDPDDEPWLDQVFEFGSGDWRTRLSVAEVLDTTAAPLRYRYQGVPVPSRERGVERDAERGGREAMDRRVPPELVGATDEPVPLRETASVGITVERPVGPRAAAEERGADTDLPPTRTYLVLENVTGSTIGSGTYAVYVNVPQGEEPGAHPERRAGHLSMFGVLEASRSDEAHAGSGRTFSFDITDLLARLEGEAGWEPSTIRVTLEPDEPPRPGAARDDVRIGRISVYQR